MCWSFSRKSAVLSNRVFPAFRARIKIVKICNKGSERAVSYRTTWCCLRFRPASFWRRICTSQCLEAGGLWCTASSRACSWSEAGPLSGAGRRWGPCCPWRSSRRWPKSRPMARHFWPWGPDLSCGCGCFPLQMPKHPPQMPKHPQQLPHKYLFNWKTDVR